MIIQNQLLIAVGKQGHVVYLDPDFGQDEKGGLLAKVFYDFSPNTKLSMTTSVRESDYLRHEPIPGLVISDSNIGPVSSSVSLSDINREELFQEFRLSLLDDWSSWLIGVTYHGFENKARRQVAIPGLAGSLYLQETPLGDFNDSAQDVNALNNHISIFSDYIVALSERTKLTTGFRYSEDEGEIEFLEKSQRVADMVYSDVPAGGLKAKDTWRNWSSRAIFDWTPTETLMLYAGASEGYRPGGFNTTLSPGAQVESLKFDDERSLNIETGFRTAFYENTLLLNAALFNTKYRNMQFQLFNELSTPTGVANADAISQGIDLETTFMVTPSFMLGYAVTWLNKAEFTEAIPGVVQKSQTLMRAPEFSHVFHGDYSTPWASGTLRLYSSYSLSSSQRLGNDQISESTSAILPMTEKDFETGSFGILNARLSYSSAGGVWQVGAWGTNLTDESFRDDDQISLVNGNLGVKGGAATAYFRNSPRSMGVDVTFLFSNF